jgi:hypothetical protein
VFNDQWSSIEDVTDNIRKVILELIPELPTNSNELPYIMAIYKFHKKKYRWISNAFESIYVDIATLIIIATMFLQKEGRQWAKVTVNGYNPSRRHIDLLDN